MCRPKHVEQLRNIEIINSTTRLHLVGSFHKFYKNQSVNVYKSNSKNHAKYIEINMKKCKVIVPQVTMCVCVCARARVCVVTCNGKSLIRVKGDGPNK